MKLSRPDPEGEQEQKGEESGSKARRLTTMLLEGRKSRCINDDGARGGQAQAQRHGMGMGMALLARRLQG